MLNSLDNKIALRSLKNQDVLEDFLNINSEGVIKSLHDNKNCIEVLVFLTLVLQCDLNLQNKIFCTTEKRDKFIKINLEKFFLLTTRKKVLYRDLKLILDGTTAVQDAIISFLALFMNNSIVSFNHRGKLFRWLISLADIQNLEWLTGASLKTFYSNVIEHIIINIEYYKNVFNQKDDCLFNFVNKNKNLDIEINNLNNIIKKINSSFQDFDSIKNTVLFGIIISNIYHQLNKQKNTDIMPLNKLASLFYGNYLVEIPKLIWFYKDCNVQSNNAEPFPKYTLIANNYRYHSANAEIQGKCLWLEKKQSSIGYNIYLPENVLKVNAVYVDVYGGDQASARAENAEVPGLLSLLNKKNLDKNIVVVTLNLPDLLELKTDQTRMSSSLHDKIHACINKFYTTLRNTPESLHPYLRTFCFQESRIILGGASFGGRTAVRHSQLYPQTFDGYISLNGWNSIEDDRKYTYKYYYSPWLDPGVPSRIATIIDELLLVHNRNDHRVRVLSTLDFHKTVCKEGKSNLVRLAIFDGSAIPVENNYKDVSCRGHDIPSGEDEERYFSTIADFIQDGHSPLTTVSQWRRFTESTLAQKFYHRAKFMNKFLAEALIIYKKNPIDNYLANGDDQVWEREYKLLFYAVLCAYDFSLTGKPLASEIRRLDNENLLTSPVLSKVLQLHENIFVQYLNEYYGIEYSDTSNFFENSYAQECFKKMVLTCGSIQDKPLSYFIIFSLFKANPELLESLELDENPTVSRLESEAKKALLKAQDTNKDLIRSIWKQAFTKVFDLKTQKKQVGYINCHGSASSDKGKQPLKII